MQMMDKSEVSWGKRIVEYLHTGEHSDFVIRCRGYEWEVHRVIIGAASPYFQRLTSGPFEVRSIRPFNLLSPLCLERHSDLADMHGLQEAREGLVDLSDDDPETIARLLLYMYFGEHPHYMLRPTDWQRSLAKLLHRPGEVIVQGITLPSEAILVAAAHKYQMRDSLLDKCKAAYKDRIKDWDSSSDEDMVLEFIASLRIIYQSAPAAGLRGRAITTAQYAMPVLQHRKDFHELMLATPEFAIDLATKGLRHVLWCKHCSKHMTFDPSVAARDECKKIWDWIDHGRPQDWKAFQCKFCYRSGTCTEMRQGRDDNTAGRNKQGKS